MDCCSAGVNSWMLCEQTGQTKRRQARQAMLRGFETYETDGHIFFLTYETDEHMGFETYGTDGHIFFLTYGTDERMFFLTYVT
jgi:hypothetical protein